MKFIFFISALLHTPFYFSVLGKDNCWDIVVAEGFFQTLEVGHDYRQRIVDKEKAAVSVFGGLKLGTTDTEDILQSETILSKS